VPGFSALTDVGPPLALEGKAHTLTRVANATSIVLQSTTRAFPGEPTYDIPDVGKPR